MSKWPSRWYWEGLRNIVLIGFIIGGIACYFVVMFKRTKLEYEHNIAIVANELSEQHAIRKLDTGSTSSVSKDSAWNFFVLFGGSSSTSESTEKRTIGFYWKDNDGEYRFFQLPFQKVRFVPDDQASVPSVKFRWVGSPTDGNDASEKNIVYAVVTCKPADWPIQDATTAAR
jgi:hypothetical protein